MKNKKIKLKPPLHQNEKTRSPAGTVKAKQFFQWMDGNGDFQAFPIDNQKSRNGLALPNTKLFPHFCSFEVPIGLASSVGCCGGSGRFECQRICGANWCLTLCLVRQ